MINNKNISEEITLQIEALENLLENKNPPLNKGISLGNFIQWIKQENFNLGHWLYSHRIKIDDSEIDF